MSTALYKILLSALAVTALVQSLGVEATRNATSESDANSSSTSYNDTSVDAGPGADPADIDGAKNIDVKVEYVFDRSNLARCSSEAAVLLCRYAGLSLSQQLGGAIEGRCVPQL